MALSAYRDMQQIKPSPSLPISLSNLITILKMILESTFLNKIGLLEPSDPLIDISNGEEKLETFAIL